MKIFGEFFENKNDLYEVINVSTPTLSKNFHVIKIEEKYGWAWIVVQNNESEFEIRYSSCMFDASILIKFLAKIINLEDDAILGFDNEGSSPILYAKTIDNDNIRLIFMSDYEIYNAFCNDEVDDYKLTDFKIECDLIINKKYLLEEFYNILYPFTNSYNFEESYYPEFNLENGKKYLNQIKKYIDK